jgi:hypothetical protein
MAWTRAEARPAHQDSALGLKADAMRKYWVAMLVHVHELATVHFPIRANVHSTLPLERFFSC